MKTVAIVGGHPKTRKNAPWKDPNVDIWVLNEALSKKGTSAQRADAVFQMHVPGIYQNKNNPTDPDHWDWLQQLHPNMEILMQEVDPLVPNAVKYPLEEISAMLDNVKQGKDLKPVQHFTASVAYAIALAIHRKYSHIKLYGFEMAHHEEYAVQREGVMFWLGFAAGRGINLEINCMDGLLQKPLYGYETFQERKSMLLGIKDRLDLLGILPQEGNLVTIRILRELKDKLYLTEAEHLEFNIQSTVIDPAKPAEIQVKWDVEKEKPIDVEITEVQRKIINAAFEAVDKAGKFNEGYLALYEKFQW
jgi:hypothetical protein